VQGLRVGGAEEKEQEEEGKVEAESFGQIEGNVDGGKAQESHQHTLHLISMVVIDINFLEPIFSIVIPLISRKLSCI